MEEENFWITRTTSSFEWAAYFMVGYLISLSLSRLINLENLTITYLLTHSMVQSPS